MNLLNVALIISAILLTAHSQAQLQLPVSNCLGNCYGCQPNAPLTCLNIFDNTTGKEHRCANYYQGPNCQIGGSYYNVYAQSGVLDNFANWSQPSQPAPRQCDSLSGGGSYMGIGPFSKTLNATKFLQFSPTQGVQRLLIKIGVGVSDIQLTQGASNITQKIQLVNINGTIFQIITNTTSNQSSRTIPFVQMELRDMLFNSAIIKTAATGYSTISSVQTNCGFVYQFQLFADALPGSNFQQLMLNLFLPSTSNTLWWLFDFRVQAGCSGFSVGVNCDSCLTGFYPSLTSEGLANGCQPCDYTCSTCRQGGTCLSCQSYATFYPAINTCTFPTHYSIYNQQSQYQLIRGTFVNSTSSFFSQVYSSQGRQLSLGLNLVNSQSYLFKFHLMFPAQYPDNNALITLTIDGQTFNLTNFDKNRGTLSNINGGTSQLFIAPIKIDRMNSVVQGSSQMTFQLLGTTIVSQFFVADPIIIQFQCTFNCLSCPFSLSQVTTCQQCQPFYSRQKNCLVCANGFFQVVQLPKNRCVKCYSNCKQCHGPKQYDCIECFKEFELTDLSFHMSCVEQIINTYKNNGINTVCSNPPAHTTVMANSNCSNCLSSATQNIYHDKSCIYCWVAFGYAWGRCGALTSSGLTFYASQAILGQTSSGWVGNGLTTYTCTNDYPSLVGVPNIANNLNNTTPTVTSISSTFTNLPTHSGLHLAINLFKVDRWAQIPTSNPTNITNTTNLTILPNQLTPLDLIITISSPNSADTSFTVKLNNSHGANICGQSSNQMIWTLPANVVDHSSSETTVTVNAPDKGIFVSQLQLYLGNCPDCSTIGLSYQLFFLPVYADNDTQTGIDVFITFNKPIEFNGGSQFQADAFTNSFTFTVNNNPIQAQLKENILLIDPDHRFLLYFLPLTISVTNVTVTATTDRPDLIFSQEGPLRRQLVSNTQSRLLQRYVESTLDTRKSMEQLSNFFTFFTWFTLITMIVAVGLGVGVVFQQFSQMMQLIFLHIYITSWLLPPTLKIPLSHAFRMEHLNYFANITGIEQSLFGLDPRLTTNFIFRQFNIDVYFLRSFYAIIFINIIFIVWFILFKILEKCSTVFGNSPNKLFRFLRSIPSRPLSYFDQIWRYQFLATMWACMLQFTNFTGEGGQIVNLIICVMAFVIAIIWPFVVTIYAYQVHSTTNAKHFLYLYHDMLYLKTSSLCDQPKSYLYIGIRAGKLLAYALFIALFINNSIIGPVLLIFYNLIEGAIAIFLDIYRNPFYLLTKILQNIFLIVAAILCMIIFGFADNESLSHQAFQNLGYGLTTVFVLMIINGNIRFFYLAYKKIQEWSVGTYDVGERGELVNYYDKSPVAREEPPGSQRTQN